MVVNYLTKIIFLLKKTYNYFFNYQKDNVINNKINDLLFGVNF